VVIPGECLVLVGSACPSSCSDYLSTPEICKKGNFFKEKKTHTHTHHHNEGVEL